MQCVIVRPEPLPPSFPQDELGIRIVNGREAESIGAEPGDSDSEEETPGQHKFRPKGTKTSQSLDPWKKILQSKTIVLSYSFSHSHGVSHSHIQLRQYSNLINSNGCEYQKVQPAIPIN